MGEQVTISPLSYSSVSRKRCKRKKKEKKKKIRVDFERVDEPLHEQQSPSDWRESSRGGVVLFLMGATLIVGHYTSVASVGPSYLLIIARLSDGLAIQKKAEVGIIQQSKRTCSSSYGNVPYRNGRFQENVGVE